MTTEEQDQLLVDWSRYLKTVRNDPKKASHEELMALTKRFEVVLMEAFMNRGD